MRKIKSLDDEVDEQAPLKLDLSIESDEDLSTPVKNQKRNLNVDAAFLHILGDLLNSVGVIIAALIVYKWPSLWWVDPLCTYLFAVIVLWTTRMVFWECVELILEKVPKHLEVNTIKNRLKSIRGVKAVHDVHIWSLSNDKTSFMCHLEIYQSMNG